MRRVLLVFGIFFAGIAVGGWLFSKSMPRSLLALGACESTCYKPNELAGLLVSAGIQQLPGLAPNVVLETDQCLVMKHPKPEARVHLVLLPKHDAKNIGALSQPAQAAVLGCFATVNQLATKHAAMNYRLTTNGPALQHATYLHFHFVAK